MMKCIKRHAFAIVLWSIIVVGLWWSFGSPRPALAREQAVAAHPWDWWPIRIIWSDPYWRLYPAKRTRQITWG